MQIYDAFVDLSRRALNLGIAIAHAETQSPERKPLVFRGEAGRGSLAEPGKLPIPISLPCDVRE